MNGLHEVVFNVELALGIDVISAFMFAFLLFLIKVPKTEYSRKIAQTKNTIATCYLICSALFFTCLRYSGSPLLNGGTHTAAIIDVFSKNTANRKQQYY